MPLPLIKPSEALARELSEVAAHATVLLEHLASANNLTEKFPRLQLEQIVLSLVGLPLGTAGAAHEMLTYATKSLPSIRRRYLLQDSQCTPINDLPSPPARGGMLDRCLVALIGSTTTALDECLRQLSNPPDDSDEIQLHKRDEATDEQTRPATRSADELISSSRAAAAEINRVKTKTSVAADNLERALRDVGHVSNVVNAELKLDPIATSHINRLGDFLRRYPEHIRVVGASLRRISDIAEPAWENWSSFWHKVGSSLISGVREFGMALEKLEAEWRSSKSHAHAQQPSEKAQTMKPPIGTDGGQGDDKNRSAIAIDDLIAIVEDTTRSIALREGAASELLESHEGDSLVAESLIRVLGRERQRHFGKVLAKKLSDHSDGLRLDHRACTTLISAYDAQPRDDVALCVVDILIKCATNTEAESRVYDFLLDIVRKASGSSKMLSAASVGLAKKYRKYEETIDAMTNIAITHPSGTVRRKTIQALATYCRGDARVVRAAVSVIEGEPGTAISLNALHLINRMPTKPGDVYKRLIELRKRVPSKVAEGIMRTTSHWRAG